MVPPSWRRWFKEHFGFAQRPRLGRRQRGRSLRLELLEDRVTPASALTVAGGSAVFVAETGVTHNLTVSVASGTYTFSDTGDTISLNGGPAANTVTTSGITTGGTITLDMGDHNDTVNIRSINNATMVNGGVGNETVNVSSNAPTNTGSLAGIAAALTFNAGTGSNRLVASNFGATSGDSNVVVSDSTITGFAPSTITYTGTYGLVRLIGSNSPGLAEQFTVNDPSASTFQLDSNAGGDTAVVEGTDSGTTNNINLGAGAATVTVSSDGTGTGNLDNILGTLNINEGTGAGKTLSLIDYGSINAKSVTISGTAVTGFAPATINYKAVGGTFANITLSGSNTVSDTFTVTANSPALNLAANGGGDTFILRNNASVNSIAGGAGSDTLTYGFGYTNAVSVALASSNVNGFTSAAATGISSGFTGIDVLNGTGSSTLTGENAASIWTVNATPSYYDGSNTLAFSGFTTLNGGTGGNTFNVSGGAAGYTINGNTGSDTLTGVSNAVLSSSSASGFSGTAASSIAFTAIDTLSGSGSLTGENPASVWTVSATPSYYDGSNTLTFSGFTTLNGGTGGNIFNVSGAAAGYTINGNTGSDTLTGVSNAVLSSSSASGFSGTAASSIGFSAIDTLTGSGSLTGEPGASTWNLGTVEQYVDGSLNTLTFSGFTTLDAGETAPGNGDAFNLTGATAALLNGGAGDDTFAFSGTAALTGSIDGGSGNNTLTYTAYGSGVTIDARNGADTATGISGTFANIANFVGSQFADTFDLDAQSYVQSVSGGLPGFSDPGAPGGSPAGPGDILVVELSGTTSPTLTDTFSPTTGYAGSWTFGNFSAINFDTIETLEPTSDLTVMQAIAPSPTEGQPVTYTITVTNHGPDGATNVILTDMIPAGATFVSSSFAGYSPIFGTANLGTIAVNGSVTGTLVVLPAEEGTITNTASVTSDLQDANPGDNTNTLGPTTVADAALSDTTPVNSVSEMHGVAFTGVVLATFSDANPSAPASDYSAAPVVTYTNSPVFSAGPTYVVQLVSRTATASNWEVLASGTITSQGTYLATVTVTDAGGSVVTDSNTTINVILFQDNFDRGPSGTLGPNWTNQNAPAAFAINASNQATTVGSGLDLATANNTSVTNVYVQADIAILSGTSTAGLVARYGGIGAGTHMYIAQIILGSGIYTAEIDYMISGVSSQLGRTKALTGFSGTGTLGFEVVGNTMKLFLDGVLELAANDSSFPGAGLVGMRGRGTPAQAVTFDNFAATTVTSQTAPLPFADNFNQPANSQLSPKWTEQVGAFPILSLGTASAFSTNTFNTGLALATVNAPVAANVTVQTNFTLTAGGAASAGLVARYSGTGDGNGQMYAAQILLSGGVYTAVIQSVQGGTVTTLVSTTLGNILGQHTLRFVVSGTSLQLFLDNLGTPLLATTDSSITAAGLAGMRGLNASFRAFSLTSP
jgi:uncharacterized repeat protein (TIGR01451 family)